MDTRKYMLSTETTCDMDPVFYATHSINLMGLTYTINDVEYDSMGENVLPIKDFYQLVRDGAMPKTSQVTVEKATASFEKLLESGYDILHISFSSALSGTYQSCCIAADDLREKYPDRKIVILDTRCASMGQGMLLTYAWQMKEAGKSLDEVAAIVEEEKFHLCHNFTVDDLFHLHRGGRVSKMTAILGSALGIKPTLHMNDAGQLINVGKVRGRKASLTWLVDKMEEKFDRKKSELVYISHGDAYDDAKFVADLVKKRFGIKNVLIGDVGPVIGSHSGPGTVALFFFGTSREVNGDK